MMAETEPMILREAKRMAQELKSRWPSIRSTKVSLDTQEGEDAYLWIHVPPGDEDNIRVDASGLTVDLYETTHLYVVPRMVVSLQAEGTPSPTGSLEVKFKKRSLVRRLSKALRGLVAFKH